jgi:hypothetical protein
MFGKKKGLDGNLLDSGDSLRKQIDQELKSLKKQRDFPSDREIRKEIKRMGKVSKPPKEKAIVKDVKKQVKTIAKEQGIKPENVHRRYVLKLALAIAILTVLVMFFASEVLWSKINSHSSSYEGYRNFLISSCSVPDRTFCQLDVRKTDAILQMSVGENKVESIKISQCKGYAILENNSIMLNSCSFSSLWNDMTITYNYRNPSSGLVHTQNLRAMKLYETTTLVRMTTDTENKISGLIILVNSTK